MGLATITRSSRGGKKSYALGLSQLGLVTLLQCFLTSMNPSVSLQLAKRLSMVLSGVHCEYWSDVASAAVVSVTVSNKAIVNVDVHGHFRSKYM